MSWFREHRFVLSAGAIVALLVGLDLVHLALASDSPADGEPDVIGTLLLGTGARTLHGIDYMEYKAPMTAIGVDYSPAGAIQLHSFTKGTYPNQERFVDVYGSIGTVMKRFTLEWVYSGDAMYYFAS